MVNPRDIPHDCRCQVCGEEFRALAAEMKLQLCDAVRLLREANELYRGYGLICNTPAGIKGYPAYEGSIDQGKWICSVSGFLGRIDKKNGHTSHCQSVTGDTPLGPLSCNCGTDKKEGV